MRDSTPKPGLACQKGKYILTKGMRDGLGEAALVNKIRGEIKDVSDKFLNTLVRTKNTDIYNKSRKTFLDNDPFAKQIVTAYQFSAILDDRTSDICSSLDGKIYTADSGYVNSITPPLHQNCRSLLVPVTKFEDYKIDKQIPLEKELKDSKAKQPRIEGISAKQSLEGLEDLKKGYANKIDIAQNLIKQRLYLTEVLDAVARLMPDGAWLDSYFLQTQKDKLTCNLEGIVFLANSDREHKAVYQLASGLKNDPKFSMHFKVVSVASIERTGLPELQTEGTKFLIKCSD